MQAKSIRYEIEEKQKKKNLRSRDLFFFFAMQYNEIEYLFAERREIKRVNRMQVK